MSSSSSSSTLSSKIFDPLIEDEIVQWVFDDTFSKLVQKKIEMQNLQDDASSSQCRKKRRYIERHREEADQRLYNDYFSSNPMYNDDIFRRRYRMRRELFLRIVEGVKTHDRYFQKKPGNTGRYGLSTLQKCTAAMRLLAYGNAADSVDEYVKIGETTTMECLQKFVQAVIDVFGDEYMRKPNVADTQRLLQMAQRQGFPGMLGSLDCMHWKWKNCPVALHGQYSRGDHKCPTIMLEAVVSHDLWIWHAFFGLPGTMNDINVLDRSPLFVDVLEDRAPMVNFSVNGNNYNMGYYLTDGIYPNWATFVKSIHLPQGPKHKLFATKQEAARKDVERAFGVLQARFSIVSSPVRLWCKKKIGEIMTACVILHNMIVENERDSYAGTFDYTDDQDNFNVAMPEIHHDNLVDYEDYIQNHSKIRNGATNHQLQADLVEEIWNRFGEEGNGV